MSHRYARGHAGALRHMHGWKRMGLDPRDLLITHDFDATAPLPPVASVRHKMPFVRDQGSLGSCTANAGTAMAEYIVWKECGTMPSFFSRLDLYAMTRTLEGTPLTEDSGCNVRDVCKALHRWGVCFETTWPYDIAKFSEMPSRDAGAEATHHRATSYHLAPTLDAIKKSIADGYPLIFGFECFESLMSAETARTGVVALPKPNEANVGGHCVTCIGYDDTKKMLEFQNSWGSGWGDGGCGWLPYDYFAHGLASDFVTLRRETLR